MEIPVKIISLTSSHENPQVVLRKDWYGYVVMCTEARMSLIKVETPDTVVVPMRKPTGPLTQKQDVLALHTAFKKSADVYVIHCKTPAGVQTQGMIAVPRAVRPSVNIAPS